MTTENNAAPSGLTVEPKRHIVDAAMDVARYEFGHGVTRASIIAIWRALGSPATGDMVRPTDDELWDKTLQERDNYHEWADKLADAIALHLGIDVGEHSSANNPWNEALGAIMSAPSVAELSAPKAAEQAPVADAARGEPVPAEVIEQQEALMHPATQVFFRAGLLACREYMARFVQHDSPTIAASIRANWWPSLGQDFGAPRKLDWAELAVGEYGEEGFRGKTADEVSPTQEALPIAMQFLQSFDPTYGRATIGTEGIERSLANACATPAQQAVTLLDDVRDAARYRAALDGINVIRNSIIGLQTLNWSEHVYPLVAALDSAGIEGMPYPAAREFFGTMLDRCNAAEDDAVRWREARKRLVSASFVGGRHDSSVFSHSPIDDANTPEYWDAAIDAALQSHSEGEAR